MAGRRAVLDDRERRVLAVLVRLEGEDPEGAWNSFYADVVEAAGGVGEADVVCRRLRQRKLLLGEGRGAMASYWPSRAGKEAVADGA